MEVYRKEWKSPTLDFTLGKENTEDDILKLLGMIRPEWTSKITIEKMKGGILNLMYCCAHEGSPTSDHLVVRFYQRPPELAEQMNPFKEVANLEKANAAGLGPEIVIIFNNGICYKYLEGEVLTVHRVRSEELLPYVTQRLAQLHALPLMENCRAWDINDLCSFIGQYPPAMKDQERLRRLIELVPDKETLSKEIKLLEKRTKVDCKSPMVYCHTDTKGENWIWNEEKKDLKLIDFEHSGNNCQAFEIGGHFASYNDILNPTPNTYPDREFQLKWLQMYLEYWFEETGRKKEDVKDKDVELLYIQSNIFAQMTRLTIGVALVNSAERGMFDSFEFCIHLLQDYFKYKDEVDAYVVPD